jgi:hypothetical protein
MTNMKQPGEPIEPQQRPIGNAGDGTDDGGRPPDDTEGTYFRGRHKEPPMAEKDGVKPDGEWPDAGINRISSGK